MSNHQFKTLFTPLEIGPVRVRNRVYMTPHSLNYAEAVPGEPTLALPSDRHAYYYAERAKGGVALMSMESEAVNPTSDIYPITESCVYDARCIPILQKISKMVHGNGAKIFSELWHAGHHTTGARAVKAGGTWLLPLSSSNTPAVENSMIPKELEIEEIEKLVEDFGKAAKNVKAGGFDGIELHSTHSYLFNQFLSPFYNKRTDRYGGTLENRMRFSVEVLKRIRENVGNSMALGLRLIADEMLPGGLSNDDLKVIAQRYEATGLIDFLDVDIGTYHTFPIMIASMYVQPHHEVDYIAGIKEAVKRIPILGCLGRLTNLVEAEKYLVEGKMDMVGGARGFIAEPELVKKTQEGRLDDIITCIACNQFCLARNVAGLTVHCVLNPATGRENEWGVGTIIKALESKKVLVVGGGPAGMEAARIAALRGHKVTLYERGKRLGGQLNLAYRLPGRDILETTINWYERQLKKLRVKVVLGKEVDEKLVKDEDPDAVVIATGSYYLKTGFSGFLSENISGWDQDNVTTPEEVLRGVAKVGRNVIILDDEGFVTAVGMAEMLASEGKNVEIVTRWPHVGPALMPTGQFHLIYPRLFAKGVKMTPNHYIKEIRGTRVTIFNIFTNEEKENEGVDTVIMVTSKKSENSLYKKLKGSVSRLYSVGDSQAPRGIGEAIYEGHSIGRVI